MLSDRIIYQFFDSSIFWFNFRYLRRFADLFEMPDVGLSDLSRPIPNTLIQFASAIADYTRFQEQQLGQELAMWNEVAEKGEEVKEIRIEVIWS